MKLIVVFLISVLSSFSVQAQTLIEFSANNILVHPSGNLTINGAFACDVGTPSTKKVRDAISIVTASRAANMKLFFDPENCSVSQKNALKEELDIMKADKNFLMSRIGQLKREVSQLQRQIDSGSCSVANINNSNELKEIRREIAKLNEKVSGSEQ